MIIQKKKILQFFIILTLLSVIRFFYVLPLPSILAGYYSNLYLFTIVSMLTICIYFLLYKVKMYSYGLEIILFFLILLINAIFMISFYNYSWFKVVGNLSYFIILADYFPFMKYIEIYGVKKFIKIIETISLILGIILISQEIIYYLTGHIFLKITVPANFSGRFYGVSEGFIRISVILSAYSIINSDFKIKNSLSWLNLISSISCIIFVDQSRIYLVSVVAASLIMIALKFRSKLSLRKIFIVILSVVGVVLAAMSIRTTLNDPLDGSNFARRDAISYYLLQMQRHVFTGLGVIVPGQDSWYFNFLRGPQGIYYYTDIGIFGIYASLGIFGAIWYIWVHVKGLFIKSKYSLLKYGLFVESICSFFTLSYLDKGRLISMVLFLVFFGLSIQDGYGKENEK